MIDTPFLAQAHRDAHNAPLGLRSRGVAPARADRIMGRLAMLALAAFVLALLLHGLPR